MERLKQIWYSMDIRKILSPKYMTVNRLVEWSLSLSISFFHQRCGKELLVRVLLNIPSRARRKNWNMVHFEAILVPRGGWISTACDIGGQDSILRRAFFSPANLADSFWISPPGLNFTRNWRKGGLFPQSWSQCVSRINTFESLFSPVRVFKHDISISLKTKLFNT